MNGIILAVIIIVFCRAVKYIVKGELRRLEQGDEGRGKEET